MAKSARPGGKGKETHFNRAAKGSSPAREGRPQREDGDRPAYRKSEGSEGRGGYAPKRGSDSRFGNKSTSGYQRDDRRDGDSRPPRREDSGERRSFGSDRGGTGGGYKRSEGGQSGERRSFGSDRGGNAGGYKRNEGGQSGERRSFGSDRGGNGGGYKRNEGGQSGERRSFGADRGGTGGGYKRNEGGQGGERRSFGADRGERSNNYERRDRDQGGEGRGGYNKEGGDRGKSYERKDRDQSGERRSFGADRGERSSNYERKDREQGGERRSFSSDRGDRSNNYERKDRDQSGEGRGGTNKEGGERRSFGSDRGERKQYPSNRGEGSFNRNDRPQRDESARPPRREGGDFSKSDRPERSNRSFGDKPSYPPRRREEGGEGRSYGDKPYQGKRDGGSYDKKPYEKKPYGSRDSRDNRGDKPYEKRGPKPVFNDDEFRPASNPAKPGKWDSEAKDGPMTLNKYLAHSGVSSRRDAAAIIKDGKVSVNGTVLNEPGYRVQPGDRVELEGTLLKPQRNFVYVLLNKPKDFITTTEDDRGRRTVMELVAGATEDRLYPIGRLDRNTTGVLLMTNDGDLAQKLSHPKYESKKIYQVSLDKDLTKRDFDKIIAEGVTLDDGVATVDRLAYLDQKSEIGLEIHSGRNRIVRRIFESLGYDVVKLDRVMYAGLTKKNVTRGKWRFLSDREVIQLKHFRS
jgi:23S rRNA pseudouridine2605 synthase